MSASQTIQQRCHATRRAFLAALATAGGAGVFAPRWLFADKPGNNARSAPDLMTRETGTAIRRGLDYLVKMQNDDGSFGRGPMSRNVAVCSLAGLAFMSHGSMPGRGPFGGAVKRTLDFVLSNCKESGFIIHDAAASHGPMYEHGFAALFLAEAYGMSPNNDLRDKVAKATKLIVDKQNAEGGWRYMPERRDADISVTICQVMALRAARNAGLFVPNETIDRCIDYVKRCQNADGGFSYQIGAGSQSQFPRSAAGVVALYSAGIYEGDEIRRGLDYLLQFLPGKEKTDREGHYFYGHYYAVQAMWHAGGEYWTKWYPAIRDQLVARQRADGNWLDSISLEYGTAMACLVLQMPNSFLPIFQK